MTLSWWALFLAALAGALMALGGLSQPSARYTRPLIVAALVLFTASGVLALVVAGQT